MIKQILSAAVLSFALVSAAWALPAAPKTELPALNQSDIIQVGKKSHGHHHGGKHYNKHYNKHYKYHGAKHWKGGRYYHGGRYWGHRYYYRPWNWQALGCVVVGPVWYCP
jgi:Ni/Co efflux regulator RcnB